MYGRSEIDLKFPTPIPVHITYQTAFVDDAGKLQIRKDIYGRDAAMLGAAARTPQQGSRERGRPRPAELCPAQDTLPAGVTLRQRQFLHRARLLRAPVRRPVPDRRRPVGRSGRSSGSHGNPQR